MRRVLCCPWSMDYQGPNTYLESLINAAIDDGVIVLFGAGNGKQAWPGDMPSVISVGGVYVEPSLATRPSSYTSWYQSQRYAGRLVPDVCGVSGDRPRGVFLPLPVPPMSDLDQDYGMRRYPMGDHISPTDGWVFASGSSAATAQVAGIAALLLQKTRTAGRTIDQAAVKNLLKSGASPLNITNNSLFQGSTGVGQVPIHPGTVNASTSLSMV